MPYLGRCLAKVSFLTLLQSYSSFTKYHKAVVSYSKKKYTTSVCFLCNIHIPMKASGAARVQTTNLAVSTCSNLLSHNSPLYVNFIELDLQHKNEKVCKSHKVKILRL